MAKADASAWLALTQTDIARGDHVDPAGNDIAFEPFARAWLADKVALRPATVELYTYLLQSYLVPTFGHTPLTRVDSVSIRRWHAKMLASHLSPVTVAKCYRLLRQILEAAVDDRLIRINPCRLKGAATERTGERAIPTMAQVRALADAIDPRYQAAIWLAALGGLRRGECLGLARRHVRVIDDVATVTVERALIDTDAYGLILQEPKTAAGHRTVTLPRLAAEHVRDHLDRYVDPGPDALLFTAKHNGDFVSDTVWRLVWARARRTAKAECTFHDLRHFAGTLNATAGATTKEAMARLGHASPDAALRYQHVIEGRDAMIATAVDQLLRDIEL
jgi:integrase